MIQLTLDFGDTEFGNLAQLETPFLWEALVENDIPAV
jgi:hypothetical protein